jgi:hypothetical protein
LLTKIPSAFIFIQSMVAREPSRSVAVVPASQATYAGGIDFLESIPGLLKS